MSSNSWQDRRFMGMVPKVIHEGSSSYSPPENKPDPPPTRILEEPPSSGPTKTFSFAAYEGDRRFMGMVPKQIHEPARRSSGSSATKPTVSSSPPTSPATTKTTNPARRRSSASSQGGIFSGFMNTRSSDEHQQRRQSWEDMKPTTGFGSIFGGLINKDAAEKK